MKLKKIYDKEDNGERSRKKRPHNYLFLNVYINYAILLVVFAILLGFIYMNLYQDATKKEAISQLEQEAKGVAKRLNEYFLNEDYDSAIYEVDLLTELRNGDIWTISNQNAKEPMNKNMESVDLEGVHKAKELDFLIEKAYEGITTHDIYYSEIHLSMIVSVCAPIKGKNKEVCGVIVMNKPLEAVEMIGNNSLKMIIISSVVAAMISIIIAFVFVRNLTRPIIKMRNTALKLAVGNYDTKTFIHRKDEIGDLAGAIDFLSDKLGENEKIRKDLDQMRLDFFANVSHELRTPITVVRAYTESLVDGVVTDESKIHQYYERMLAECKSMERLVGDLLLLSKMQNPDFVIEMEPINLTQVFDEIIRGVKAISQEKNIHVKVVQEQEAYMMYGDYDRIRQMFLIIIDNAIKFSPDHSTIYITLSQTEKINISIRDEGIGISEEEITYVFEKFYKSKLRQNAKGSGLGLSIAKQIATKHGGTIQVMSKVGEGTEFVFQFDYILGVINLDEKNGGYSVLR